MISKLSVAALAVSLVAVAGGGTKCTVGKGPTPNGSQGTVQKVEHHPSNDTTVLYIRIYADQSTERDTMTTSGHDWDNCEVGAVWPKCLKSWK